MSTRTDIIGIAEAPRSGIKMSNSLLRTLTIGSLLLLNGIAANADAAVVTDTFTITANDFQRITNGSAVFPFSSITGAFSVTFDNSSDIKETTVGLSVSGLTLPETLPVFFAYGKTFDTLVIGSEVSPLTCAGSNPNNSEFCFFLDAASTSSFSADRFYYSEPNVGFESQSVVISTASDAVPEPGTWTMMIGGLGLVGGITRHRRSSSLSEAKPILY